MFRGKSYHELPWSRREAAAHHVLSRKNLDQKKLRIWTLFTQWLRKIVAEVKIPNAFHRKVILRTKFSPGKLSRTDSAANLRQGVAFMADPQQKLLEDIKLQPGIWGGVNRWYIVFLGTWRRFFKEIYWDI